MASLLLNPILFSGNFGVFRKEMVGNLSSSSSNSLLNSSLADCLYEPMEYLKEKFVIVGVLGTFVCIVGMGLNLLAAYLLGRLVLRNPSPLLYLFTLALLDVYFLLGYILMFSVQIYFDYFHSLLLYQWWNAYLPVVFTLGKIVQTASTYLLVCASVERFMDVDGFCGAHLKCFTLQRLTVILTVLTSAVVFRGIGYWALQVNYFPNCTGFASHSVGPSELGMHPTYRNFNFYSVSVFQVFLPFCVLLFMNTGIIFKIRRALVKQKVVFKRQSAWQCSSEEKNLRSATKMLLSVISCYLLSNILSVFITVMEYTHEAWLYEHIEFYTFSVDCINWLYILTATVRLIIYVSCSEKIRAELCSLIGLRRKENNSSDETQARLIGESNKLASNYSNHPSVEVTV